MPQVLQYSSILDNQHAGGGSKGEIYAFLQQWLVKIVKLSPVGILEPLGINHGPKRSSSKGQDYIDHIRAISYLSIELRSQRDEASDPDSKRRDDVAIRALLAARSKAVNRSKNGSKPWFPEVAKTIEKCLVPPDSLHGARKNTFTKYMNYAVVSGVPEDLPEALRCTPPSEYMEFARRCLERRQKSRDQMGVRGFGNGETVDSTKVDNSEVSKSQKVSESSSSGQAQLQSTVGGGDSYLLQGHSSSFAGQESGRPTVRSPAGRDKYHGLSLVPGNQTVACLPPFVPVSDSTNSCKDRYADSMAEADAIEALAKMQSGRGEQATRIAACSSGASQFSSIALHGTAMMQCSASTRGDCMPRSREYLANSTRSPGFGPCSRHGQSRVGVLQAIMQRLGAEPGESFRGSDSEVERKADVSGATAVPRSAGAVETGVEHTSLQRPVGHSSGGYVTSTRLCEQVWLGPGTSEALPSVQVVMDDDDEDEEDEDEGSGRVARRLDSQSTVVDHHAYHVGSEMAKDGSVLGEHEALAPNRPRFDHPTVERTLSVGLGPCHEVECVTSSPMPRNGSSSSSEQQSGAHSLPLQPRASEQPVVAVSTARRPADLMRRYPTASTLVATGKTSLTPHTRSSGHQGIATGSRMRSAVTGLASSSYSSSFGDLGLMHTSSGGSSVVRVGVLGRRAWAGAAGAHAGAVPGMKRSRSMMSSYRGKHKLSQPYSSVSMMVGEGGTSGAGGAEGRCRPPCAAVALESGIGMPPAKVRKVSAN